MKIRAWAEIIPGTSVIEIPDEDVRDRSEEARERVIWDYVDSWVNGIVRSGYDIIEPVTETPKPKRSRKR